MAKCEEEGSLIHGGERKKQKSCVTILEKKLSLTSRIEGSHTLGPNNFVTQSLHRGAILENRGYEDD